MATDKVRLKEITDTTRIHCEIAFNDKYYKTVKALMNKLKKNKEFSMDSGKVEGWIAGLLYIVGEDSELFNPNNWIKEKRYISKTDLASGVNVSPTTMRNRAAEIREVLPEDSRFIADLTYKDEDIDGEKYYTPETLENMANMISYWSDKVKRKPEYEIYLLKARRANNYEEALEYIDKALINAKEKIEADFDSIKGQLWSVEEARPYIMVKDELAYVYALGERFEDAIKTYNEILKLDEEDNLGVRYKLFMLLMQNRKFEEGDQLIEKYKYDESTFMEYTKALYYFVKKDEEKARECIHKGLDENKYVPVYLLGMKEADTVGDEYVCGSVEEAMYYFQENAEYWLNEEGSLYWLIEEYFNYLEENDMKLGHSKDEAKKAVEYALRMMEE
ncbi:MAG: DUF6398 domain-containing protein [Terrisporobacter sp.]|uniref:DUF6398 domain-containing protein n=1 Tax=Terrisporobacter sp. TaxID=1965305 RepID=UPI002FCACE73